MDRDTSSLTMTLLAVGWEMVALFALDRVTVKASSFSTSRSPVASTVMVAVLWPAAKLTWPDGIAPPKSVASASPRHAPVRRGGLGQVPGAGHGEGEGRGAVVALGLAHGIRRDAQVGVVVDDEAGSRARADLRVARRVAQGDAERLVAFHVQVPGHVQGDGLARLAPRRRSGCRPAGSRRSPPRSPSPDTFQSTVVAWSVSPVRVTVKV